MKATDKVASNAIESSQKRQEQQYSRLGWTLVSFVQNFRAIFSNIMAGFILGFVKDQLPTQVYRYKEQCPLPSELHTRYLTLLPAQNSNQILRCILNSAIPDKCQSIEAVSYVWGGDEKVSKIYCHGHAIAITASLDAVLRSLRLPDAERTLWVDALCIDQGDLVEQGHQVRMMGQIYRVAGRTVIHLGPDFEGHAKAVASLLEEITQRIERQGGSLIDSRLVPNLTLEDSLSTDKRWESYRLMVGHTWFSRTWTVQEAALGGNPYILWGSTEILWLRITGINQWLLSKARHVWFHLKPWLNDVHGRGFWMAEFEMPNFVETLARAKSLRCTDNRDRIYAFLGSPKALIGEHKEVVLDPDYTRDCLKVYHDFAVSWLTKTQDLRLLSAIEHREDTLQSNIPTWVPRWDVTLSTNYYGLFSPNYDASKGLPVTAPDLATEDELRVTGIIFDTIIWRSAMLPEDKDWQVPRVDNSSDLLAAWTHLAELEYPKSHIPRIMAFVRVLCRQAYGNDPTDFHPDEAAFALFLCHASSRFGDIDELDLEKAATGGDAEAFVTHAGVWAGQRSVALTESGRYALVSAVTREGDECCVFTGMPVPVIVRSAERHNCYQFIGEAFVLGIMHGELHRRPDSEVKPRSIIIM
jgi:hypothetical protein